MIFKELKSWFNQYRPHEQAVIDLLTRCSSDRIRDILIGQLEKVNKIQRHLEGREVNLYCMKGGKAFLDESLRFPNRKPELLLAIAKIKYSCAIKQLSVEVWLANGRFFSLVFSRSPNDLGKDFEVNGLRFLADPLKQFVEEEVTTENLARVLGEINATLPEEYINMLGGDQKRSLNGWKINDISEIRKISLTEKNYYLLAEKEDYGAIAVAEANSTGTLFYLGYEDDSDEKIDLSIIDFINQK